MKVRRAMLNPNTDRLDYGQILTPPADCYLDFAVGTTYSLDLDALVGATLALGLSEETDTTLINNEIFLLEALVSTGDKVALFCESGQIHMPHNAPNLYALLEKMVFPVTVTRRKIGSSYPSFHPKFWLIRYQNSKHEKTYRLIVLSRNLTFDRSWDITCYLDGKVQEQETDKNEPVCDFLKYLIRQLPSSPQGKAKAKAIREMIRELSFVRFISPSPEFHDFKFIPNGIGEPYRFDNTRLYKDTFHDIAIISPFLSKEIIKNFNNRNQRSPIENSRYMLITREQSLSKLDKNDVSNFELYVLKDQVVYGEEAISDEQENVQRQDIHAKVYMYRKGSETELYLGSLNASKKAFTVNVEFMLCLYTYRCNMNLDILKNSLFGSNPDSADNPFMKIDFPEDIPEDTGENNDMEDLIKTICRGNPRAAASLNENGTYDLILQFDAIDTGIYEVKVRPLLWDKAETFGKQLHFSGLPLIKLSDFYSVSVSDKEKSVERILIITTEGIPEEREKAIMTSVISSKYSFYSYISYLLGDESFLAFADEGKGTKVYKGLSKAKAIEGIALYEKMLQTAASSPEKFKGIEYLLETITDDNIIPPHFRDLFDTFRKVVKLNG